MINLAVYEAIEITIQLHSAAINLSAQGDDKNAMKCLDMRQKLQVRMSELANA